MNEKKFSILVSFFLLVAGVVVSVTLVQNAKYFFSQKDPNFFPQEVRLSNISNSSFTVSWITTKDTIGFIQYGKDAKTLSTIAYDDRDVVQGETKPYMTHHVTLRGLQPSTTYFFKVGVDQYAVYPQHDTLRQETAPVLTQKPLHVDPLYGKILINDTSPATHAIVYFSTKESSLLSTLVKDSGSFIIAVNSLRSKNLTEYTSIGQGDQEDIFVQAGRNGIASAITTKGLDSPVPSISLGKTYDFRVLAEIQPSTEQKGFGAVLGEQTTESSESLKKHPIAIINPAEGEVEKTSYPLFLGKGVPGNTVRLQLERDQVMTLTLRINADGQWVWRPETSLSSGEYTIRVKTQNEEGKDVSLVKTFTIAEGEVLAESTGLPSLVATPSAQIQTPVVKEKEATPSMPDAGSLAPTFWLFLLGLSIFLGGLFIHVSSSYRVPAEKS
ncbi:MAG TPA: fibronectin type III domain-containing protein [Patescibacteria group bacterium]|nr:fibronectin type III domain-containing protein [Patescibacteria group bacterium]